MFEISDTQKIGVGLTGFGIFFIFLGMLLLFDKSLLALGNILFLCGLAAVIGRERTVRFFFQKHKIKGSCAFFGGIIIVMSGWPMVGMLFEAYGFFLLFSGFFPVAINFLRRIPLLGTLLNMPGISKALLLAILVIHFFAACFYERWFPKYSTSHSWLSTLYLSAVHVVYLFYNKLTYLKRKILETRCT